MKKILARFLIILAIPVFSIYLLIRAGLYPLLWMLNIVPPLISLEDIPFINKYK